MLVDQVFLDLDPTQSDRHEGELAGAEIVGYEQIFAFIEVPFPSILCFQAQSKY